MNLKKIIKEHAPDGAIGFTYEPDLSVLSFYRFNDDILETWSDEDNQWLTYVNAPASFVNWVKSEMKPL